MKNSKNKKIKINGSINSVNELRLAFERNNIRKSSKFYNEIEEVTKIYPMRISPHVFRLCLKSPAVYKQFIPDKKELSVYDTATLDPLKENHKMPVKNLIHMYPDRVLLLTTDECFSYCRFCTRKRLKRDHKKISTENLNKACRYISEHKQIRDVILSGGDPLTLNDSELEEILKKIRNIKNVKIIRIGTRTILSCPSRITDRLVEIIKKYKPIYVNVHFNSADEFTQESVMAIKKLVDNGIPLNNLAVLMKGINNSTKAIKELFYSCVDNRVRSYYLSQCDEVQGTEHFWTDYQDIFKIAKSLIGNISGLAIPYFIVDCKGLKGKVRVLPDFYTERDEESITLKAFNDRLYTYKNLKKMSK